MPNVIRDRAITALETLERDLASLLVAGVAVNETIHKNDLSVALPSLDLLGIADTRCRVAELLGVLRAKQRKNFIEAARAALAPASPGHAAPARLLMRIQIRAECSNAEMSIVDYVTVPEPDPCE